jgi:hypothetical protein
MKKGEEDALDGEENENGHMDFLGNHFRGIFGVCWVSA